MVGARMEEWSQVLKALEAVEMKSRIEVHSREGG